MIYLYPIYVWCFDIKLTCYFITKPNSYVIYHVPLSEEAVLKSAALHNYEKLYSHAMQLQIQVRCVICYTSCAGKSTIKV